MTKEEKDKLDRLHNIENDPLLQKVSNINVSFLGLQIIVINDIGNSFTPVIDFNLAEL